jgi:UDP-glucose-4-epimerase GalE
MKVLVTGGAGYIGSHACKALAAKGIEPVVYDSLVRGHRGAVKWGPLEQGDIGDAARLRAVLDHYEPAAIMHFAAYAYVGESNEDPLLYYENNFAKAVALLRTIVDRKRLPLIFSSTCATYGIPNSLPISEDHPQSPINPYGRSKLFIERMLADADAAYQQRSVSLRYFNAAGADPEGEIGELHDPETHLIPLVLAAARDKTPVRIFGDDYDTPDGTCVRDYVHVCDIVDAHVCALDYLWAGGATCALNLANTRGYSVKEVIAAAERVTGKTVPVEVAARRPGDPPVLVGSAERAKQVLGWTPKRPDLDVQIKDAWNWMIEHNRNSHSARLSASFR